MDIAPESIVHGELIGLEVEVEGEPYRSKGLVLDETRNMLVILAGGREKKIPKAGSTFVLTLPDKKRVRVRGDLLLSQPENRIPKRKRR